MRICAYVLDRYAKQAYAQESHDVRAWPGFEMVLHAVRAAGYAVEYAGRATVHQFDVVLVSITSDCDWWPFIAERTTWKPGKYIVVAGGAGVLNVRPFLPFVHSFVLGRGEHSVPRLLDHHKTGGKFEDRSIIWSDTFSSSQTYTIAQTDVPYPHEFKLTNGKPYQERHIGCPNKCLFCGYTWQRRYIGDGTYRAGADSMSSGNRERTIIDLLRLPPERWQDDGPVRIVGLDGMSERLRFAVNKRISREMLREFFRGLVSIDPPHQVKVYCIVGYPTETEDDWMEFSSDLELVDAELPAGKQWSVLLHVTPFRAMPATPAATWPMSLRNYRGVVSRRIKQYPWQKGNIFYQGNRFWAVEGMGTDSLPTVIQSAICLRGTEDDSEAVATVARAPGYWKGSSSQREAALSKLFDVGKLFSRHSSTNLPTRYLDWRSYQARIGTTRNL